MPATLKQVSPQLSIEFEGGQDTFAPGDTIIGRVYRRAHVVTPDAQIKISLHGRAKSKVVVGSSNNRQTYRSRFALIDPNKSSQVIFSGPLHIGMSERHSWRFAITIPTHWDHLVTNTQLDGAFVPDDPQLPPTVSTVSASSTGTEGFVEYYLQANLRVRGAKDKGVHEAIMPFNIYRYLEGPPTVDFKLKKTPLSQHFVQTQRLIPGMEDAELSRSQRMKKFFGTSSIPSMGFRLEVNVPGVIQLESPETVPFWLRVTPLWGRTSEVVRNVPQMVKVTGLTLKIRQIADVQGEGTFRWHTKDSTSDMSISLTGTLRKKTLEFLSTDNCPPIDIGRALGLRIGPNGAIGPRTLAPNPILSPNITTFNFKISHRLKWSLTLEVAGEMIELSHQGVGTDVVVLLPSDPSGGTFTAPPLATERSESWIRPPKDEEPPPSFAEVQKQDEKEAQNSLAQLEEGASSAV
ncbi:hypothetical protein ACO1O0_000686 [Amphichorda felina]